MAAALPLVLELWSLHQGGRAAPTGWIKLEIVRRVLRARLLLADCVPRSLYKDAFHPLLQSLVRPSDELVAVLVMLSDAPEPSLKPLSRQHVAGVLAQFHLGIDASEAELNAADAPGDVPRDGLARYPLVPVFVHPPQAEQAAIKELHAELVMLTHAVAASASSSGSSDSEEDGDGEESGGDSASPGEDSSDGRPARRRKKRAPLPSSAGKNNDVHYLADYRAPPVTALAALGRVDAVCKTYFSQRLSDDGSLTLHLVFRSRNASPRDRFDPVVSDLLSRVRELFGSS